MYDRFYRLVGKALAFIGMILVLFPVISGIIIFADANNQWNPPRMFISTEGIFALVELFLIGLITTFFGMLIHKIHRREIPFFIKDGGPIHAGEAWTKGSELGLFLTKCGIVISTNQESNATFHVGYRIIGAERATCGDCILGEGRAILEPVSYGRQGL